MKILRNLVARIRHAVWPVPLATVWESVDLQPGAIDAHPRAAELLAILKWNDVRSTMAPRECAIRGDLEEARTDLVAMVRDTRIWQGATPDEAIEFAVRAGLTFVAKYTD